MVDKAEEDFTFNDQLNLSQIIEEKSAQNIQKRGAQQQQVPREYIIVESLPEAPKTISCRICNSRDKLKTLIRICHCEDDDKEYVHQKCLSETLSNHPNFTKVCQYYTIYGCLICEQLYPIIVKNQFTLSFAWTKHQTQLKICLSSTAFELLCLVVITILLKQQVIDTSTYYLIFILTSLIMLFTILYTFNICMITKWQFADKYIKIKNQHQMHQVNEDWQYDMNMSQV